MKLMGEQSRISFALSMAKDQGKIDNHFTPGSQTGAGGEEVECLFVATLLAFLAAAAALAHGLGVW